MVYRLKKHCRYKVALEGVRNYAGSRGLVVTFAYLDGTLSAIVGGTRVSSTDTVIMKKRQKTSGFTFRHGYPEQRVVELNMSYHPRVVENEAMLRGVMDVYDIE